MVTGKKMLFPVYLITGVFGIIIFLQWIFSYKAVVTAHEDLHGDNPLQDNHGWNNTEVRRLKKDILWYEQSLMLSKPDSNSLSIDLHDHKVELKLKGVNLAEAEIIHHYPEKFLEAINEEVYFSVATVSSIENESANFPKKTVRRIQAYSNTGNEEKEIQEIGNSMPLQWTFTAGNNLKIVISGVHTRADSTFAFHPKRDLLLYRAKEFIGQPVAEKYSPTLYLWLNDMDAKAIYRAVPSEGKMLFRN